MSQVTLKRVDADAEAVVVEAARVSANPKVQSAPPERLLRYLLKKGHWSPLEMVHMTVEIYTSRDIARQMLRHRSFSFQEFSQRYQDVGVIQEQPFKRECRMQDPKNRQNSLPTADESVKQKWDEMQEEVWAVAYRNYQAALLLGIAKEQARALLPEGMTATRMYMVGNMRSWFHYCKTRGPGSGTQKEHMEVAVAIRDIFVQQMPVTALFI